MENMTRKTNELKKGTWVRLRNNGWYAQLEDNMRGNTRMAEVHGYFIEIGSIYSHDIIEWSHTRRGNYHPVEHTPSQKKLKKEVDTWQDTRMF